MEKIFQLTPSGIDIGATLDTPPLYSLLLEDDDHSILKLPYKNSDVTISDLISTYSKITSCPRLKDNAVFYILQGFLKGERAKAELKFSSLHLDPNLPCFRAADPDYKPEQSLNQTEPQVLRGGIRVRLRVEYEGDIFEVMTNSHEGVEIVKSKLLRRPEFAHFKMEQVQLIFEGLTLLNRNKVGYYKGLMIPDASVKAEVQRKDQDKKMYLTVNYDDGHEEAISVPSETTDYSIKAAFSKHYQLHSPFAMKILSNGMEINGSLLNYPIKNESRLLLRVRSEDESRGYVHPQSCVRVKEGWRCARELSAGDSVAVIGSFEESYEALATDPLTKCLWKFYKVSLQSGKQVMVSPECLFSLPSGQLRFAALLHEDFKEKKEVVLKKWQGGVEKVVGVELVNLKRPGVDFFWAETSQSSLVLEGEVIWNTKALGLWVEGRGEVTLGVVETNKISAIKESLSQVCHIPKHSLRLFYNGQELPDETTLQQHKVQAGSLVQVKISKEEVGQVEKQVHGVRVVLEMGGDNYELEYLKFKEWRVQEVMKYLMPTYKSSYFFLFCRTILLPTERLSKIEESGEFGEFNRVVVVKNQKLSFIVNMDLRGEEIRNVSYIAPERVGNISLIEADCDPAAEGQEFLERAAAIRSNEQLPELYRRETFFRPFLYFLNAGKREEMRRYIRSFEENLAEGRGGALFRLVKCLYTNLVYLPSHITEPLKETFFAVRNFRFSQFYKKNDTFYLYEFLLTHSRDGPLRDELKQQSGTLFRLTSVSGKNISALFKVGADPYELLFPPYTYFLVDRVESKEEGDEVWVSEVCSPVTLQKDIVLWVDDVPRNNVQGVEKMMAQKDLEILPLVSTLQAEKWVREFGWLMDWKGIRFKLVSDMGRMEHKENSEEKVMDYNAGFELLERVYVKHGLKVKTYIFCGDKSRAENILMSQPRWEPIRSKYKVLFKITTNGMDISQFACQDKW